MPVEQINNSIGAVEYLHHDQQGSTRLLTGSTGKAEATFTYGPYGELTGSTGTATTPLGYDGQYTNSDTGLIYLRAREYDPKTAQFLSVDPLVWLTRAPYTYSGDNPLNFGDPSGRAFQICVGGTVSLGFFSVEGNMCYVNTPHGEGVAISGGASRGPGVGVNVHVGAGGSNAQTPEDMVGRLQTLEVAHKLDSVATRVRSLVRADHAIRLWLAVLQVFQPASGPRPEQGVPTQKWLPSSDGFEV
jgi:RHS repeat-associated protein